MIDAAFIAVDWGTTNRRIYSIAEDGTVLASERDGHGILAMKRGDYPGEIAAIRARHGDLPVICAGMVGSNRGWAELPYLPCPADLPALAAGLTWIEPGRTAIVPGLSFITGQRGDVMRGEEVQLLGAVAAGYTPADALLCQPGTHCKWAQVAGGAVVSIRTCLTGELFALLRQHSLLADTIAGDVADGPAFLSGVTDAAKGQLLSDLFAIRASALLDLRPAAEAASYASGLLIGNDVREQSLRAGAPVYVLADPALGRLYAAAINARGANPVLIDSHLAFAAGITAIWRLAHDCR
ncbi:2-dehydro-3-deoxygalactonokinase [Sphingomonas sp. 28-63-12]|uniref:2-dehydro-3-deoxygalactonokinase n=1 Tax=Sphingomonas sp. 28-63-12 TaxID=1970434 RepID=UPI000BD0A6DB|nr:MAG: 2-oxo-3-deoxygalactonate kinase [Sphingomonas sp. 28-63-12]